MTWAFEISDVDPKELELEAQFAELFLRAGGRVTKAEWDELDAVDAMALVVAGDRLRVQGHLDASLAGKGTEGATLVLSQVDGGSAYKALRLRTVVREAAHAPS